MNNPPLAILVQVMKSSGCPNCYLEPCFPINWTKTIICKNRILKIEAHLANGKAKFSNGVVKKIPFLFGLPWRREATEPLEEK